MRKTTDTETEDTEQPYRLLLGITVITSFLAICIFFNVLNVINFYDEYIKNSGIELASAGQLGDFMGGFIGTVVAFIGVLLLFITLNRQSQSFKRERFEQHFFEMLKIYRDNVNDMEYTLPSLKKINTVKETIVDNKKTVENFSLQEIDAVKGRQVFLEINREFLSLYMIINHQIKKNNIKFNLKNDKDYPSIVFITLFFGLSQSGRVMLKKYLSVYEHAYPELISFIYKDIAGIKTDYNSKFVRFGGHQIRLGHYFRHLYQTVNYVHKQPFLTRQEKYDYIKVVRAQMSTYEQVIFFYNSLSLLGSKWEFDKITDDGKFKTDSQGILYKAEDLLITEYNIIKNIPSGLTIDNKLDPKKFFPKLIFEGDPNDLD